MTLHPMWELGSVIRVCWAKLHCSNVDIHGPSVHSKPPPPITQNMFSYLKHLHSAWVGDAASFCGGWLRNHPGLSEFSSILKPGCIFIFRWKGRGEDLNLVGWFESDGPSLDVIQQIHTKVDPTEYLHVCAVWCGRQNVGLYCWQGFFKK